MPTSTGLEASPMSTSLIVADLFIMAVHIAAPQRIKMVLRAAKTVEMKKVKACLNTPLEEKDESVWLGTEEGRKF